MDTHSTNCMICGADLIYSVTATQRQCVLCASIVSSTVECAGGHFVCDACHSAPAAQIIQKQCMAATGTDPVALATEIMRSPLVGLHGPEHHFLVPAVLLATYDNARGKPELKAGHLREAEQRAARVPGGFCGTHGNCGAGVGTGIFWSITRGATPLSTAAWGQSNRLTARSLLRIADQGGPRCCKRDTYLALLEATRVAREYEVIHWECSQPACEHSKRNKQCQGLDCPFYPAPLRLVD